MNCKQVNVESDKLIGPNGLKTSAQKKSCLSEFKQPQQKEEKMEQLDSGVKESEQSVADAAHCQEHRNKLSVVVASQKKFVAAETIARGTFGLVLDMQQQNMVVKCSLAGYDSDNLKKPLRQFWVTEDHFFEEADTQEVAALLMCNKQQQYLMGLKKIFFHCSFGRHKYQLALAMERGVGNLSHFLGLKSSSSVDTQQAQQKNKSDIVPNQTEKDMFMTPQAIARQLLSALQYLHEKIGRVHGDIKPDNVIVMLNDGVYRVVLTDFGLSKSLLFAPKGMNHDWYTYGFRAPEGFRNKTLGFWFHRRNSPLFRRRVFDLSNGKRDEQQRKKLQHEQQHGQKNIDSTKHKIAQDIIKRHKQKLQKVAIENDLKTPPDQVLQTFSNLSKKHQQSGQETTPLSVQNADTDNAEVPNLSSQLNSVLAGAQMQQSTKSNSPTASSSPFDSDMHSENSLEIRYCRPSLKSMADVRDQLTKKPQQDDYSLSQYCTQFDTGSDMWAFMMLMICVVAKSRNPVEVATFRMARVIHNEAQLAYIYRFAKDLQYNQKWEKLFDFNQINQRLAKAGNSRIFDKEIMALRKQFDWSFREFLACGLQFDCRERKSARQLLTSSEWLKGDHQRLQTVDNTQCTKKIIVARKRKIDDNLPIKAPGLMRTSKRKQRRMVTTSARCRLALNMCIKKWPSRASMVSKRDYDIMLEEIMGCYNFYQVSVRTLAAICSYAVNILPFFDDYLNNNGNNKRKHLLGVLAVSICHYVVNNMSGGLDLRPMYDDFDMFRSKAVAIQTHLITLGAQVQFTQTNFCVLIDEFIEHTGQACDVQQLKMTTEKVCGSVYWCHPARAKLTALAILGYHRLHTAREHLFELSGLCQSAVEYSDGYFASFMQKQSVVGAAKQQ